MATSHVALHTRVTEIAETVQQWKEAGDAVAELARQLVQDIDRDLGRDLIAFSTEANGDIFRRLEMMADDVEKQEVSPEIVVRQADELLALVEFFISRQQAAVA